MFSSQQHSTWRCTSRCRTGRGSAAATKTPTDCCDSSFPKAPTSRGSVTTRWPAWSNYSTNARGNASDIEHPPKSSPNETDTGPLKLHHVPPIFPPQAKRLKLEGDVILKFVITPQGDVTDLKVVRSLHTLLDNAAKDAVRQWKYEPTILDGIAVPVEMTYTMTFGWTP